MTISRIPRQSTTRGARTSRRGAVRRLSALGTGALLAGSGGIVAKKSKKAKRCKRDRKELKRLKSQEFCPQRGCCECSATASLPAQCATFPGDTFGDDCQDLCTGSSASFGVSPTAAFANFCGTDALCVRIDCPVA